jgi:hypothetical protein
LTSERLGDEMMARYRFAIDGARFADYMLTLAEKQLQAELPVGITLQPSKAYQTMTGRGELWVDAAGFPRRQILELEMSEASTDYLVRMRVVVEFCDFGQVQTQSTVMPDGNQDGTTAWRVEQRPVTPTTRLAAGRLRISLPDLGTVAPSAFILFLCIEMLLLLLRYRQAPRAYAVFALGMVVILVCAPVLQTLGIVRFVERQPPRLPRRQVRRAAKRR